MLDEKSREIDIETLKTGITAALKSVYDPEIPVNIYELGLIYSVDIDEAGGVTIRMTLTSPNCPVAESLPHEVEREIGAVEGVSSVKIDLVWDPPWTPDRMSDVARLTLNLEPAAEPSNAKRDRLFSR